MTVDVGALTAELAELATGRRRTIIGICGAPGAGKTTLAGLLVGAVNRDLCRNRRRRGHGRFPPREVDHRR